MPETDVGDDDPRARWRVLPAVVQPTDDGVKSETSQADFDEPPVFDPIQGTVRYYG